MKLWDKGYSIDKQIEAFTVGKDRELDLMLAPYDVMGTIAHTIMLESVGLLTKEDLKQLLPALREIYQETISGQFTIAEGIEDIHSQVEFMLTERLGDTGKKVHTGRSRNDQVLVDLKLFTRARIEQTVMKMNKLFEVLQLRSEETKDILMPGYTHLQVAMPSSFGLWFGAYAESISEDLRLMLSAYETSNLNPLGSAAGYGSSAPLNRRMTTKLLGFTDLNYNSIYAQMTRGKAERIVAMAYSSLAESIGRMATDCCMFNSQNFGFIHLPDALTTGSSIMPHKKNPDVFELLRAHSNRICSISEQIRHITTNLPTGYFRDMQLIKEVYLPLFDEADTCIDIATFAISEMTVSQGLMKDSKYQAVFSVEEVNRLASEGVPFREAYKQVAARIADGTFKYEGTLHHTHEGSIGNLCTEEIRQKHLEIMARFPFAEVNRQIETLTKGQAL